MSKRELVQLADDFDATKHGIGGWFMSEKLDGQRAYWDGGWTRGWPASKVPFANCEKHDRLLVQPISTGLWSRYGQVIRAPKWFIDELPSFPLDGELWAGRGQHQFVESTVKDFEPGPGWDNIQYMVFDTPPHYAFLSDGRINNPNMQKVLKGIFEDFKERFYTCHSVCNLSQFISSYGYLEKNLGFDQRVVKLLPQIRLPWAQTAAIDEINKQLDAITDLGGEGLMLRKPESPWTPRRVNHLLKVKKLLDSEATVIGYTSGRETDKGSKLLGLMGALIVSWQGKRFEIAGFNNKDHERVLSSKFGTEEGWRWAVENPGQVVPDWIHNTKFPIGSQVTFRYRELTDAGIPKEARYWRKYNA